MKTSAPTRRHGVLAFAAVTAGALILTGCGVASEPEATAAGAATITVTHAQGESVVPVNPQTVLTFDLAALMTLVALEVDVAGLPKSNLPGMLSDFASEDYLDIGTLFEPDYEAVNAAEPDLIIVAGRSAAAYPQLRKIAPTIDLSNDAADFGGSVVRGAEILGEIFEKQEEVESLAANLAASTAATSEVAADSGNALIILTSAGEVTAYGPGSRFGFLHDELGVTPAVEDVETATHGEAVSFEFLLETDPDWLFVVDRDAATAEGTGNARQVLDNELMRQTSAWKNDQIVYVDPVTWYIVNGGVTSLQSIADEVHSALTR